MLQRVIQINIFKSLITSYTAFIILITCLLDGFSCKLLTVAHFRYKWVLLALQGPPLVLPLVFLFLPLNIYVQGPRLLCPYHFFSISWISLLQKNRLLYCSLHWKILMSLFFNLSNLLTRNIYQFQELLDVMHDCLVKCTTLISFSLTQNCCWQLSMALVSYFYRIS